MILIAVVVFSTHKYRGFLAPGRKSSSRQLAPRLDLGKVHMHYSHTGNNGGTNWKSTSPPIRLLTMILFVIATPKIILTVP
jgi:hypothetical protein